MKDKIIKLTSAAYKLLDFFPESDPLKNRAKEKALAIMSALGGFALGGENSDDWLAVGEFFSADREKLKARILQDIDVLLGYVEVGRSQGWLSGINCLIVCNEYEKIKKQIGLKPGIGLLAINDKFQKPEAEPERVKSDFTQTVGKPDELTARQSKILEFLRNNEKAQVMDLQTALPDVTKRTIRRDLDELLKAEKIERLGEFNQVFYKIKG